MTDPDTTRDRAMEAFVAAVCNIQNSPGQTSNLTLARQAVDAIAHHTIAIAAKARDQHIEALLDNADDGLPQLPPPPART